MRGRETKGMTLTEVAIVLGAMGLILGALWTIVGTVWDGYRFQKLSQQVQTIAQSLQEYYGNTGNLPTGNITAEIDDDTHRLVPVEMRLDKAVAGSGALRHAMGGALVVKGGVPVANRFQITLQDLKQDACVKLLMQFPVLVPEMGVVQMGTAAAGMVDVDPNNLVNPSTVPLPLSLSDAMTWCSDPLTNEVRFAFRIIK